MTEVYEIVTYGGGAALTALFDALAAISKGKPYQSILYIGALYAGLWAIYTGFGKNQGALLFKHLLWVWVLSSVLWTSTVRVRVQDPVSGEGQDIDNVPMLIGYFGSRINSVGTFLTQLIEDNLKGYDHNRKFGTSGLTFGSKVVGQLHNMKIRNAELYENMESFITNCVAFDAAIGKAYTIEDLRTSKDLYNLVLNDGHPVLGMYYRPFKLKAAEEKGAGWGEYKSCKEAGVQLQKDFDTYLTSSDIRGVVRGIAKTIGIADRKFTAGDSAKAEDIFMRTLKASLVTKVGDNYSHISGNAVETLRQAMMIHAINDSSKEVAESLGAPTTYASTKAMLQQRNWYNAVGENAANMLVTAKVIFEVLIYGSFLIIAVLALLPNGVMIVLNYLSLILWLELWQPLYAILNYAMNVYSDWRTSGIIEGSDGFNMNSLVGLGSFHADLTATAGYFSLSIPFLAYGILGLMRGGASSIMHAATGVTSGMTGTAAQAAAESTSGSTSIGAVNYQTSSMNQSSRWKTDENMSYMEGRTDMQNPDGTISFMTPDGKEGFKGGAGISTTTYEKGLSSSNVIGSQLNASIAGEKTKMQGLSHTYSEAESSLHNKGMKFLESANQNIGRNDSWGMATTTDSGKGLTDTLSFMKGVMKDLNISEKDASEFALMIGLPGIGGVNLSSGAATQDTIDKVKKYADDHGYTESMHKFFKNTADSVYSEQGGQGANLARDFGNTYSKAITSKDDLMQSQQTLSKYQQAQNLFQSGSVSMNEDLTQRVFDKLRKQEVSGGIGHNTAKTPEESKEKYAPSDQQVRVWMHEGGTEYNNAVKEVTNEIMGEFLQKANQANVVNIGSGNVFENEVLNNAAKAGSSNIGVNAINQKEDWQQFVATGKDSDLNMGSATKSIEDGKPETKQVPANLSEHTDDNNQQVTAAAIGQGVKLESNPTDIKKNYQNVKATDEQGNEATVNLIDQFNKKSEIRGDKINQGGVNIQNQKSTMSNEHDSKSDDSNVTRAENRMMHDNVQFKTKYEEIELNKNDNNINQSVQTSDNTANSKDIGLQNDKSQIKGASSNREGSTPNIDNEIDNNSINQSGSTNQDNIAKPVVNPKNEYTVKAKEIVFPDGSVVSNQKAQNNTNIQEQTASSESDGSNNSLPTSPQMQNSDPKSKGVEEAIQSSGSNINSEISDSSIKQENINNQNNIPKSISDPNNEYTVKAKEIIFPEGSIVDGLSSHNEQSIQSRGENTESVLSPESQGTAPSSVSDKVTDSLKLERQNSGEYKNSDQSSRYVPKQLSKEDEISVDDINEFKSNKDGEQ
jgi:conjugal transfer mating pair stabilization protein TraG